MKCAIYCTVHVHVYNLYNCKALYPWYCVAPGPFPAANAAHETWITESWEWAWGRGYNYMYVHTMCIYVSPHLDFLLSWF